jgi:hypothetical protein
MIGPKNFSGMSLNSPWIHQVAICATHNPCERKREPNMGIKGNKQQNLGSKETGNPGNIQQGRQAGHNTGQEAWKNNVKLQSRNDPGAPKTTGPEKKETKGDFKQKG